MTQFYHGVVMIWVNVGRDKYPTSVPLVTYKGT